MIGLYQIGIQRIEAVLACSGRDHDQLACEIESACVWDWQISSLQFCIWSLGAELLNLHQDSLSTGNRILSKDHESAWLEQVTYLPANAAVPNPWEAAAVAKPLVIGSLWPNLFRRSCTQLDPQSPVRATAAAAMETGALSCWAMGIASATVTLLGAKALAISASSKIINFVCYYILQRWLIKQIIDMLQSSIKKHCAVKYAHLEQKIQCS